ncbi:hypothetical protein KY289_026348 [Solanum tuberosum]|nr:hypothetical protein KY289_026347 [Solanum tuberosum]KAH0657600.1 hypothetical protein KY289_026348 [Solanum tuberosum]
MAHWFELWFVGVNGTPIKQTNERKIEKGEGTGRRLAFIFCSGSLERGAPRRSHWRCERVAFREGVW